MPLLYPASHPEYTNYQCWRQHLKGPSQHPFAACPPEILSQISRLVDSFRELLAGTLVGIYLHGSLSMGCFNPALSDIDLLVVTSAALQPAQRRRAAELLLGLSTASSPIEITFLAQDQLHPWRYTG
ncbi:MAG: nucleotidyltransferase domain-containing protein [Chloroflexota bacterium]